MGDYINEALLDASPYKKQQDEAKGLVNKWSKTGLLAGLNEDFQKSGMAVLLENQARQLINEFTATGGKYGGNSAAGAGSSAAASAAAPQAPQPETARGEGGGSGRRDRHLRLRLGSSHLGHSHALE